MQPILSLSSAAGLDHRLIESCQLSESALIDSAALGVYRLTREMVHGRVLVMVGPGNNGSDGLEIARLLSSDGYETELFFLSDRGNPENLRRRRSLSSLIPAAASASGYDTVFDALFGFSFHGTADERTIKAAAEARTASTVISVDVPSAGLVEADCTVALMTLKDVLYEPSLRSRAGRILLFNPGFPEESLRESPEGIYLIDDGDSQLPSFSSSDYKNTRGHLAILGGSERYTGAPRLAARAAFFSGAGLVTIVTDSERIRDENPAVIISSPCDADLTRYNAIVAGPGWDDGDETLFDKAVASGRNMVVDADALKFVPGRKFGYRAVLTPHIGEYRRLMAALSLPDGLGESRTLAVSLRRLAAECECFVVLKSSVVWITGGDEVLIYDGSNPSLGVAGSGDVLAGIIGALLAEGESVRDAARDGVILHQRAGRKAHERYGYYSAEELIAETGRCR